MRYLGRQTHRISVAWLHEVSQGPMHQLIVEESNSMCADIYTKAFSDRVKLQSACDLINIVDPRRLTQLVVPEAVRDASTFSSLGGGIRGSR